MKESTVYRVKTDGFHGELFRPEPVRSLSPAGGKPEPRRGDPGGEDYRPRPADFFQNGHHVAFRPAAEQVMKRLRRYDFPYVYQHLSYNHGSHLFVPMELRLAKYFRGDRGKYKELSRKARMDSLIKTLEFVAWW